MRKKVWMWEFILFFSLAVVLCGCGKTVTTTNDSGVSDDVLRGYKTIDGKLYRFDENGVSVEGLYEENGSCLFVTRGLGNSGLTFRLFNRPEVAILTLHKG